VKYKRELQIRNWALQHKFRLGRKKNKTTGVSSRLVGTSLHVLFLDYDSQISDSRLIEELQWLQTMFKIGNFIVFKSSEYGRHATCLDVLTSNEVLEIVRVSNCDETFKTAPIINPFRSWVLRYCRKGNKESPNYLYTVESPYEGENLQSLGHAIFLMKNYGVKVELQQPFGTEDVEIQTYYTN
jgi:hypothetical protein